jgi:hypothetical protein
VKKAPGWDGPAGARHYPHRSGARPSDLLLATRRIRGILPTIMWRSANRVSIQRITPLTCGICRTDEDDMCLDVHRFAQQVHRSGGLVVPAPCRRTGIGGTLTTPADAPVDVRLEVQGVPNGTVLFITDERQMHHESLPGSGRAPARGAPQAHSPRTCGPRSVARWPAVVPATATPWGPRWSGTDRWRR